MADREKIQKLARKYSCPVKVTDQASEDAARDWLIEQGHYSLMDDIYVDDAMNIIRRDYEEDVASIAKELMEEMKASDIDDFSDALHGAVDGTQRVIYTYQAMLGVIASKNDEAYVDQGVELDFSDGIPWSQLMYFAMYQDVIEYIAREGMDVNDPRSWEEKQEGYTPCPCCGIDSMDEELCSYCEEAGCDEDGSDPKEGCGADNEEEEDDDE